jgi:hypothetical protein
VGANPPALDGRNVPPTDEDGHPTGQELQNATLAGKLASNLRLTKAEWAECGIYKLHSNDYIRVGDAYYRPAKPLAEQLIDFASLTLTCMSHVGNELVCSECLDDSTRQVDHLIRLSPVPD